MTVIDLTNRFRLTPRPAQPVRCPDWCVRSMSHALVIDGETRRIHFGAEVALGGGWVGRLEQFEVVLTDGRVHRDRAVVLVHHAPSGEESTAWFRRALPTARTDDLPGSA